MKKIVLSINLIFFFLLGISYTNKTVAQEIRYALLIGNSEYEGSSALPNSSRDVDSLSSSLIKYGFEITKIKNADKASIERAVNNFSKKIDSTRTNNPNAYISTLFYYSGHGQSYDGINYLIPIKISLGTNLVTTEVLDDKAVRLEKITNALTNADVRLFFFDACRNGNPVYYSWKDLPKFKENLGSSGISKIRLSKTKLYGTFIGFSTAVGSKSYSGEHNAISPYVESIINRIKINPQESLEVIMTQVSDDVKEKIKDLQVPNSYTEGTAKLFCFDPSKPYILPPVTNKETVITMAKIEGGTPSIGCDKKRDGNCRQEEMPLHPVMLTNFWMSQTEITNAQYATFLNEYGVDIVKEGKYKGEKMISENEWGLKKENGVWKPQIKYENHPVVNVTWYGANEFCKYYGGSLPSEAQWEYAARGGNKSKSETYAGSNNIDSVAWYKENSYDKGITNKDYGTHPVATKKPNQLGLYDMTGNVWEWCQDSYDANYYSNSSNLTNPVNEEPSEYFSLRGGAWKVDAEYNRSARRIWYKPTIQSTSFGFRLVLPVK